MSLRLLQTETMEVTVLPSKPKKPRYLIVQMDDAIESNLLTRGKWEDELIGKMHSFYKKGSFFLDIGANIGTWTVSLGCLEPEAKVLAFEPQKTALYKLHTNIALNEMIDRVTIFPVALGDREAHGSNLELKTFAGNLGASRLTDATYHTACISKQRVPVRTLDSFGLENISVVKIDVEGFEAQVLSGSEKTLKRSGYPPIFFEGWTFGDNARFLKATFEELKRQGYVNITNIGGYENSDFLAQHPETTWTS